MVAGGVPSVMSSLRSARVMSVPRPAIEAISFVVNVGRSDDSMVRVVVDLR